MIDIQEIFDRDSNNHIISFYTKLIEKHGISHQALDWGSKAKQEIRFDILTQIDNLNGHSLLDVGCGFGDILSYLQTRSIEVDYTGYDITPKMIELAQQRFPNVCFQIYDLTNDDLQLKFDYVLASGIFYLRQLEGIKYLKLMINRMFSLCRKGIAFNVLSSIAAQKNDNEFYANSAEVLTICLEITPLVVIRHDYLPNDFTVYLYRGEK